MKKKLFLIIILLGWILNANAANLLEVYNQAVTNDPIFQQAIAQSLVTKENVPISIAAILPNIVATTNPTVNHSGMSGTDYQISSFANVNAPRNLTVRTYSLNLTITQPVFNFALFSVVNMQLANAHGAEATLNAALQSLMVRVANAYFAILKDEENLNYNLASKRAYQHQLDQTIEQFKVGIKTQTEVDTSQASYDTAYAKYIEAQALLSSDRENLRAITGVYYSKLAKLKDDFPLVTPHPANIEAWVATAITQNWSIRAAQYSVKAAKENIHQQFAGHLPTVTAQGSLSRAYSHNINRYISIYDRDGPGTTTAKYFGLNINLPIFSGGGVIAATNQAQYNYQLQDQILIQTVRDTVNKTRQSYLNIEAGISQVKADRAAMKSTASALSGMQASYEVGTETLVDVLNQQEKVYQAQTSYATDRFALVNNILGLKQAAGTLSTEDLHAINAWLVE